MLFDLEADIAETRDVSAQHPETVAGLMNPAEWAQQDIGDHDTFGENARTFGAQRRRISNEVKSIMEKKGEK